LKQQRILISFFIVVSLLAPCVYTQGTDSLRSVSFLALGDVNLGRLVGQEILKGNIDYPFAKFVNVLHRADLIFANLECPVTDQKGETQSPKSNIIFCAPPAATQSLKRAGITVVSTANNHAYDYGLKGIRETIQFLNQDSIRFTGTVSDSGAEYSPVILEHNGITFGIVAYTQFVNIRGSWEGMISVFDSARARHAIEALKPKVDFILASYHGGDEYKNVPGLAAEREMKLLAEFGADVVLGHHPHVPQGIFSYRKCFIFSSLGNAVFNQPQRYWTQRSFSALIHFRLRNAQKELSSIELIPIHPGFQIEADLNDHDTQELMDRIKSLSTVTITHTERGYFVEPSVIQSTQK
jgi:poly-gamma-glutamate capsule biosynthesis protein CapA/YwtB (metallophosphatase superfamily)